MNRFGEYTMDGVGNSETNVPSLPKDKHIPDPYRDFGLSLSFQWEADIWGKLTRKKQAAARSLDGFRGGYPFCPVDVDLRFGDSIL